MNVSNLVTILAAILSLLAMIFRPSSAATAATLALTRVPVLVLVQMKGLASMIVSFPVGSVLSIGVNWTDNTGAATSAPGTPPTFSVSDPAILKLDTTTSPPTVTLMAVGSADLDLVDGAITTSITVASTPGPASSATIVLAPTVPQPVLTN